MALAFALTLLVGLAIVVQGGINARLGQQHSLWLLVTIGNAVAALGSGAAWLWLRRSGPMVAELQRVPWLVLVPSVAGIAIVAGMPAAIARVGVGRAVVLVIAVQLVAGLLWDRFGVGGALSAQRLAGAALVMLGSWLVVRG